MPIDVSETLAARELDTALLLASTLLKHLCGRYALPY